jgi:hypothetical protein
VADKIPVKFNYDGTTPSALGEFTSEDTVPVLNGGTGVSSLDLLGLSLSSIDVSSASVSATKLISPTIEFGSLSGGAIVGATVSSTLINSPTITGASVSATVVSGVNFYTPDAGAFNCMGDDGVSFLMKRENGATYENLIKSNEGTITIQSEDDIHFLSNTGEKFMRLNESGGDGEVELYYNNALILETTSKGLTITGAVEGPTSVSATAVSGVTFNGMSYPPPFAYAQLTGDGTAEDGEQNVGIGAAITDVVSDSNYLDWDDTNKYFNVSATGTYEFTLKLITTVGGTSNITIKLKKNAVILNTVVSRIHSSIDPTETTLTAVFNAVATDTVSATTTDDNTDEITVISGTTMILKRLN